jgi:DNA-binding transcriptional regulator YdaS (Cro superfamily)
MRKPFHTFALDALGPRSITAAAWGVDKSRLTRWAKNGIPAERVLDVERITGIPREQLRPDLYTREASQ